MAHLGRCPRCSGKIVYSSWRHAANDAKALNRKKRNTGRMEPYVCPAGKIHVGRCTSNTHKRRRAER